MTSFDELIAQSQARMDAAQAEVDRAMAKYEAAKKKWERRDRLFIRPMFWFSLVCLMVAPAIQLLQLLGLLPRH